MWADMLLVPKILLGSITTLVLSDVDKITGPHQEGVELRLEFLELK